MLKTKDRTIFHVIKQGTALKRRRRRFEIVFLMCWHICSYEISTICHSWKYLNISTADISPKSFFIALKNIFPFYDICYCYENTMYKSYVMHVHFCSFWNEQKMFFQMLKEFFKKILLILLSYFPFICAKMRKYFLMLRIEKEIEEIFQQSAWKNILIFIARVSKH